MKLVVCNHLAALTWSKRPTADILLGHFFIQHVIIVTDFVWES